MLLKGLGETKMFWQDSPPALWTANQFYRARAQMYQYSRESAAAPRVAIKAKPVRLRQSETENEQLKKQQNPDDI